MSRCKLFGTAKRLHSHGDLKVSIKEHLINFVSGYKYLRVTLDPSLNMNDHLQKTLKNVTARIRLKRMRRLLLNLAVKSVYTAMVLPKVIYCSNPVIKVSETMANKYERLQSSAVKIIYKQPKSCRECGFLTIQNQKRYKAAILMFQCIQGAAIPHFTSYINNVEHKYNTRGNLSTLPKVRTEAARKSFMFQGPVCYNDVPVDIRNLNSLIMFKHKLKEHLLNN